MGATCDAGTSGGTPWWEAVIFGLPVWGWLVIAVETILLVVFIARKKKPATRT